MAKLTRRPLLTVLALGCVLAALRVVVLHGSDASEGSSTMRASAHSAPAPAPAFPAVVLPSPAPAVPPARPAPAQPVPTKVAAASPAPAAPQEVDAQGDPLLDRWESEADDPEWTRNQEAAATALFELFQLSRQSLLEVDCRTSVCRLEIEAHELAQLSALSQHLQEEHYPVSYSLPTEGGPVVAYVAREGMEREVLGEHFAASEAAPP